VRVKDELVEKVLALTAKIVVGDPFDPKTTMGPLNNEGVAAKMEPSCRRRHREGCEVLAGGGRAKHLPTSLYYQPTILDGVTADMAVNREESFGADRSDPHVQHDGERARPRHVKPLRLGQDQRRHGIALSLSARTRIRFRQTRRKTRQ